MSTELSPQPCSARLICDLLHSALKQEEENIRKMGRSEPRIKHYLCSVAFAEEIVVGYLLRKEALRRGIPIEAQRRFSGPFVDVCFFEDDEPAALCEIKGPWHVRRKDKQGLGKLKEDLQKLLNLPDVPSAKRYHAWIVVAGSESSEDLKQWVKAQANGIGELDEWEIAPEIPINRAANEVAELYGDPYERLWVIVFSLRR